MRTCLARLEAYGIIQPGDPDIVAARVKRADRRPKGWDLDLTRLPGDLTEADISVLEHQFRAWPPGSGQARGWKAPQARCNRCSPHQGRGAISVPTGCNRRSHGGANGCTRTVQRAIQRTVRHPARGYEALPVAAGATGDGGLAGEVFDALGPAWRLTSAQQARLAPAVLAALDAGWTPRGLAGFTGANTDSVRNPFAVLAARLFARRVASAARPPAAPATVVR